MRNPADSISRNNGINSALNVNAVIMSSTGSRAGGVMNVKNAEVGFICEVAL